MVKTTGIIFSNSYDETMGELTKKRASASLPIGGRYRLVDFMLSNMVNSGIISVGILTKYNYRSLLDHLGSGSEWDLNRINGGLFILPPFTTSEGKEPRGKFEAMYNAIPFLNRVKSDYIILCDGCIICKIDFDKVLETHISSGADITVVAKKEEKDFEVGETDVCFEFSGKNLKEISVGLRDSVENPVSIGVYVIERKRLIREVENYVSKGRFNFEKNFMQAEFVEGRLNVGVYEFEGTVLRNRDIPSYFKNNMLLMDGNVRNEIFTSKEPIYTKVRYEVPTFYGESCDVNNCFIADGCRILGEAEQSVIFRDVVLEKGAKLKNCVVMQGSKISEGAVIENAIIEKNTVIEKNENFKGGAVSPVIVR